jgi:hypothetical protein
MGLDRELYKKTYTSFTGTDMTASVLGIAIGSLLSVSYSVQREKAGIYTCGSPDPRSISRGKRGIAGSLIFQIFDRDALFEVIYDRREDFKFWTRTSNVVTATDVYGVKPNNYINDWKKQTLAYADYDPFYADQIPPFDITLTFLNEIGNVARMDIRGVEILNEGMGVSVEDMAIEQAMTFICRSVGKITPDGVTYSREGDQRVLDDLSYPNV